MKIYPLNLLIVCGLPGQPYFCEEQDANANMIAIRSRAIIDLFFISGGYFFIKRQKLLIIL